jgi:hypothetical protein
MYRIYDLRLASSACLTRAAARIFEAEDVASCSVEAELRRLRFVARRGVADALVQGIYAEGGLTWCSRYDWQPLADAEAAALE